MFWSLPNESTSPESHCLRLFGGEEVIRIYLYIAAVLSIAGLCWLGYHQIWKDGYETAEAEYRAQQQAIALEAHEANAALLNNLEEVKHGNLETVAALNARLAAARRVRLPAALVCSDYKVETTGGTQETAGARGAAEASGQALSRARQGLERFDEAVRADYLDYSSLIEEFRELQAWARAQ